MSTLQRFLLGAIIGAAVGLMVQTARAAEWFDLIHEQRKPEVRSWRQVHKPPARVIVKHIPPTKPERIEHDRACKLPLEIVGDEAKSKEAAELQARRHWMKAVRFDHGEKFLEMDHARDVHAQCSRSDHPITGGKWGQRADAIVHNWRCKIRATPCAAPMEREEK